MVKVSALETRVPLFAVMVLAVMDAAPGDAIRLALTATINCVSLTNVAGRVTEFQLTVVAVVKPVPFTVSENAGVPAMAADGDRLMSDSVVTVKGRKAG